jgi:glycosyltransferase involved in cell wall biosynthesis
MIQQPCRIWLKYSKELVMPTEKVSIIHYAGPPIIGGVESTIFHHIRMLNELGYPIQLLAGRGAKFLDNVPFIKLELLDSRHPEIMEVGKELSEGRVSDHFKLLKQELIKELSSVLAESQVNIVHNAVTLHKNMPLTAALNELCEGGLSLIAWCHDFAWKDELYVSDLHPGYPWELLSSPWANTEYVTVSEDRREKLAKLLNIPEEMVRVITPGVDYAEFLRISEDVQQIADRYHLLEAAPLIILPARITRRKNIEYAIRVMFHLIKEMPDAHLLITGPPGPHNPTNLEYLQQLLDLRDSFQLDEAVHFIYELGTLESPFLLTEQQVAQLYQIADILLFPSKREGFGIPVLEAALARIPVFAANIPPIQESSDGYAHVFEPNGDPKSTAQAIRLYIEANSEYALRKRVLNQFTWQAILNKSILPLIQKVAQHEKYSS